MKQNNCKRKTLQLMHTKVIWKKTVYTQINNLKVSDVISNHFMSQELKYISFSEVVISPEETPSLSVYETLTLIFFP